MDGDRHGILWLEVQGISARIYPLDFAIDGTGEIVGALNGHLITSSSNACHIEDLVAEGTVRTHFLLNVPKRSVVECVGDAAICLNPQPQRHATTQTFSFFGL